MRRLDGLWREPQFLKLWAGQSVSLLGSSVSVLAVPLVAVITLHARPYQMGVISALYYVPSLVLGIPIGLLVDRVSRRRVLLATNLLRALIVASIPAAAALGVLRIEVVYVEVLAMGLMSLAFGAAYVAFLPAIVRPDQLVDGNSKLQTSATTAALVGPTLAGSLVQVAGAPLAMLADSASYLVSAASLAAIRGVHDQPEPSRRRMWADARDGIGWVATHPILRPMLAQTVSFNVFVMFNSVLAVFYMVHDLRLGAGAIGALLSLGAAGSTAGALLARRVIETLGIGTSALVTWTMTGLGMLAVPLAAGPGWLVLTVLAAGGCLFGLSLQIARVNLTSLQQAVTPDRLRGRTNATTRMLSLGVTPLGALVAGAIASAAGTRTALLVGAVGSLLPVLIIATSPIRALRQLPAPAPVAVER